MIDLIAGRSLDFSSISRIGNHYMPYTKVLKSARKLPLLAISHKAVLIPHRNAANAAESVLFQAKNTPIGNESWITIQKLANAQ